MNSSASFKVVKEELENTIQEAQSSLEQFISNPQDVAQLQTSIDLVNQARGTFYILENKGAVLLCQELARLLTELPVQDVIDQTTKGNQCQEAISQSLVVLNRYLEYLSIRQYGRSELLLPTVNQVRRALNLVPLRDSHFYSYDIEKLIKPETGQPMALNQKTLPQLRKYRHMYQAAFLHLLKGKRTRAALSYMHRAVTQIDQISNNSAMGPLFWAASAAFECLAQRNATIGAGRRLAFSQLDRQFKLMIQEFPDGFKHQPPHDLVKDFLYIIALNQPHDGVALQVKTAYKLPEPGISDTELSEQMELLFSPGSSVMSSVSEALTEEIRQVKDMLDQAARNSADGFSANALHEALMKISDILVMVGLGSPSNVLRQQAAIVGGWADQAAPEMEQLMRIADSVLYAESAMSRLSSSSQEEEIGEQEQKQQAAETQLVEARVALVDEAESGIVLAKRSITAFMESGGDVMHLANINATLNGVKGGLTFLGSHDAATIVQHCIDFLENHMIAGGGPDLDKLEALADALSSLEFYLESLLNEQQPDPEILKVAREASAILRG